MEKRSIKAALLLLICFLFLLLFGFIPSVCNLYANRVYPYLADGLGAVFSAVAFPVGEIVMYVLIAVVILGIAAMILWIFSGKRESVKRRCKRYLYCFVCLFLLLGIVYELNWFLVLRSPLLGQERPFDDSFELEDLRALRERFAAAVNDAAEVVKRDTEGRIVYPGRKQADESVAKAMRELGAEFPRLKGYYPMPKEALCSEILDAMEIGGYTYPYTMEITYNRYITDLYYPSLIAHEMSHHKGYYRENEAVFLGCLSLMQCKDPYLSYSGRITAYSFVDEAYRNALLSFYDPDRANAIYRQEVKLSEQVRQDLDQASLEAQKKLEKEQSVPKEIRRSAKEVSDVGWDTQGKLLNQDSYDGSVQLFLEYFIAGRHGKLDR